MLKKIINKRNYIILFFIIILVLLIIFSDKNVNTKIKSFYYFGETITIEIFEDKNVFKGIDNIYKKYNKYYKDPSKASKKLINYGKEIYKKSNGYLDITEDKLIKAIKNNQEYDFKTSIDSLDNLNFETIIGYFATEEVINYLNEKKVFKYIINEDGNIYAGKYYGKGKYKISISDSESNLINIVKLENEYLSIKGNTTDFKSYMVNPKTSSKADNNLVVVIGKDIKEVNMLSNMFYLISVEEGKEIAANYDVEVMWYDDEIVTTDGFDKYILKASEKK